MAPVAPETLRRGFFGATLKRGMYPFPLTVLPMRGSVKLGTLRHLGLRHHLTQAPQSLRWKGLLLSVRSMTLELAWPGSEGQRSSAQIFWLGRWLSSHITHALIPHTGHLYFNLKIYILLLFILFDFMKIILSWARQPSSQSRFRTLLSPQKVLSWNFVVSLYSHASPRQTVTFLPLEICLSGNFL